MDEVVLVDVELTVELVVDEVLVDTVLLLLVDVLDTVLLLLVLVLITVVDVLLLVVEFVLELVFVDVVTHHVQPPILSQRSHSAPKPGGVALTESEHAVHTRFTVF